MIWRLLCLFGKYFKNYDCVIVDVIHYSPSSALVSDPQLMAIAADGRHGPRVGHGQLLALLK
jgi:hypothetical protein